MLFRPLSHLNMDWIIIEGYYFVSFIAVINTCIRFYQKCVWKNWQIKWHLPQNTLGNKRERWNKVGRMLIIFEARWGVHSILFYSLYFCTCLKISIKNKANLLVSPPSRLWTNRIPSGALRGVPCALFVWTYFFLLISLRTHRSITTALLIILKLKTFLMNWQGYQVEKKDKVILRRSKGLGEPKGVQPLV